MSKYINVLFLNKEAVCETENKYLAKGAPDTWNLFYAENTNQAMNIINGNNIDVVVAEIKDPDDDAKFLLNIKLKHPKICRILLSGNNCIDSFSLSWPIAQHLLNKPINSKTLFEKIEYAVDKDRKNDAYTRKLK
jgi:DNA-binding NtrC family response regulator